MESSVEGRKLFVAVDFGETNSTVSYAAVPETIDSKHFPSNKIKTISGYPSGIIRDRRDPMRFEVPTQILYPPGWVFRPLQELWHSPPGPSNTAYPDGNTASQRSDAPRPRLLWGWQVRQVMSQVASQSNLSGTLVYRFKTLLDQSESHKRHKQDLSETLQQLSLNRSCHEEIPVSEMVLLVTIDYLTKLLKFTKDQIHADPDSSPIVTTEMTICVPIIWGQKAIRDMQLCMGLAAKLAGFPGLKLQDKSMDNVFIVAEPEAGATWLLSSNFSQIKIGSTFLLLDAGGGTVDAQTYSVTKHYPLRLKSQEIHHSGDSCGSNALNEAFFEHVLMLLDKHEYLDDQRGVTRAGIARKLAFHDFEYRYKRSWDMYDPNEADCIFEVHGLRYDPGDPHNRDSIPNRLTVLVTDINIMFDHVCAKVSAIMKTQLETAQDRNIKTNGVVLMGGFAESRSLCSFLQRTLDNVGHAYGRKYWLHNPNEYESMGSVDAVAAGAVLRALDKEGDPRRVAKTGYGLGIDESYEKELHGSQMPEDGMQDPNKKYIRAIKWVSKLGEEVPPKYEIIEDRFWPFPYKNADGTSEKTFEIRDEIWLSDYATEDHYKVDHKRNQGAELIGNIVTDVTHLRNVFVDKRALSSRGRKKGGHKYWELHYQLVYKLDGLNMKCLQMYDGQVLNELGVNIASGLPPGST